MCGTMRRTTKQLHLLAIFQAWHLSLFGHIARMPDEIDCQDLNSFLVGELEKTTRTPSCDVDEDCPARPDIK